MDYNIVRSELVCQEIKEGESEGESSENEIITVTNLDNGRKEILRIDQPNKRASVVVSQCVSGSIWMNYWDQQAQMKNMLLRLIVRNKLLEFRKLLLQYPLELSSYLYEDGWSLLHYAVSCKNYEAVELLSRSGVDPNIQSTSMRRSALHEAVGTNSYEIVAILVARKGDINLKDSDGNSPLHIAVNDGSHRLLQLLLQSNLQADLQSVNTIGMTVYDLCRDEQMEEIIRGYSEAMFGNVPIPSDSMRSRVRRQGENTHCGRSRADHVQWFLSSAEIAKQSQKANDNLTEDGENEDYFDEPHSPPSTSSISIRPPCSLKSSLKCCCSLKSSCEGIDPLSKSHLFSRGSCSLCSKNTFKFSLVKYKSALQLADRNIGLMREAEIEQRLATQDKNFSYDVLRKVGSGSFGEVFLVRQKHSSRLFAMKRIDKRRIIDNNLEAYLRAQRHVLTTIQHPFILHAIRCTQDIPYLYIFTDLCQGGDLERVVRAQRIPQSLARNYVCQAALGIQALHDANILYRDLKAANVLLQRDGSIKLADFGLAKHAVTSRSFLGSLSYLAPEMLADTPEKEHGRPLDWYLLGVLLYEMLVGLPPFYHEDKAVMHQRILTEVPTLPIPVSLACKKTVEALLEKDPNKRVGSLQQLQQLLWFSQVDWEDVLAKKLMLLPVSVDPDLRKKMQFGSESQSQTITSSIKWFEDWEYQRE